MTSPTVFVVDDDPAIRDSLGLLLETAGLNAQCYTSAREFLDACRCDCPGCLVLDMNMAGMSGAELQAELVRRGSPLSIVFLTGHGDIPATVRAMKAGAVDFLTKPVDAGQLLNVIEKVLRQNQHKRSEEQELAQRRERLATLTPREREVMVLAVAGKCNKVISKRLGISHRTVEVHRSHILRKTNTANLLELAQLLASCGVAVDDDDGQGAQASFQKA